MAEGIRLDSRVRREGLSVDYSLQKEVLRKPQLQFLTVGAVREQRHVTSCECVGSYPQVYGQVLAAEVTSCLTLYAGLSCEL